MEIKDFNLGYSVASDCLKSCKIHRCKRNKNQVIELKLLAKLIITQHFIHQLAPGKCQGIMGKYGKTLVKGAFSQVTKVSYQLPAFKCSDGKHIHVY